VTGGILGNIQKEWTGTISDIAADEEKRITRKMLFGFGAITVTVEIGSEGNLIEESISGKQLFIFTLL
jgi:hypothetical protein